MRYEIRVWIDETHIVEFTIEEEKLFDTIDFFFERDCKIVNIKDVNEREA